jgi:hypothetical protein
LLKSNRAHRSVCGSGRQFVNFAIEMSRLFRCFSRLTSVPCLNDNHQAPPLLAERGGRRGSKICRCKDGVGSYEGRKLV